MIHSILGPFWGAPDDLQWGPGSFLSAQSQISSQTEFKQTIKLNKGTDTAHRILQLQHGNRKHARAQARHQRLTNLLHWSRCFLASSKKLHGQRTTSATNRKIPKTFPGFTQTHTPLGPTLPDASPLKHTPHAIFFLR